MMMQENMFPEQRKLEEIKDKINNSKLRLLEELEQAQESIIYFQKFLPYVSCIKDEASLILDNIKFAKEQAQRLTNCLQNSEMTAEVMSDAITELGILIHDSQ